MAEVKIDDVVYHLGGEFKKALDDTIQKFAPGVRIDINVAFRHFSVWEQVPDSCIRGAGTGRR